MAIAAALFCLAQPALAEPVASAASPDGSITVEVSLDADGRAQYSISRKGKLLIARKKIVLMNDVIPSVVDVYNV